jgi:hypothetical protein
MKSLFLATGLILSAVQMAGAAVINLTDSAVFSTNSAGEN